MKDHKVSKEAHLTLYIDFFFNILMFINQICQLKVDAFLNILIYFALKTTYKNSHYYVNENILKNLNK